MWVQSGCRLWLCSPDVWRVHWSRGGQGFEAQDLPEVALVLWSCVPSFLSALSLCLWCIALKYGSVSRFKGVFSVVWGFVWVCVA